MALDGDTLGLAIKTALDALTVPQDRVQTTEEKEATWKAIGGAIVDHITSSAVVSTVTTSAGATGVSTPGGPLPIVALPGTGAGVIT